MKLKVRFGEQRETLRAGFGEAMISGARFWFGTREQYNALPRINPDICYCIEEGT